MLCATSQSLLSLVAIVPNSMLFNLGVMLLELAYGITAILRCDFGEGEDLDNPALQERLYEDVVCRLERMKDGIRKSRGEI